MDHTKTSRYISLILRHKPETIGIVLDEHGWANVDELINGVGEKYIINREILEEIVRTDEKQRYSFNEDRTLIRANQGHSVKVKVDVELEAVEPPEYLYHGTAFKYRNSIAENGLIPKSRLYVHLSMDIKTAAEVGHRHGDPMVFRIRSGEMHRNGFVFYRSVNDVWLVERVPVNYIEEYIDEDCDCLICVPEEE